MSLKSTGMATILVIVVLLLSLQPTMAYAGGSRHHRHHRHYRHHHHHSYGYPYRHGHGVRLWFDLGAIPPTWSTLPAERGEYRVWTPSVELAQPESSDVPGQSEQVPHCREFQREVIIDGQPERAYGTACLQPDGSWKIVP